MSSLSSPLRLLPSAMNFWMSLRGSAWHWSLPAMARPFTVTLPDRAFKATMSPPTATTRFTKRVEERTMGAAAEDADEDKVEVEEEERVLKATSESPAAVATPCFRLSSISTSLGGGANKTTSPTSLPPPPLPPTPPPPPSTRLPHTPSLVPSAVLPLPTVAAAASEESRGVSLSTRSTSPTSSAGSMLRLGMKNRENTNVESTKAALKPSTAVSADPTAATTL
mmetsp:Transcript_14875/g.29820  ORF Transcript_14875/g.29820 Transcript_14875/m.29820 type:complete len:224 (+) Transcript_14875:1780-2451(+)